MRHTWILFLPVLVAGCATPRPVVLKISPPAAPVPLLVAAGSPTKIVETPYDVRGYYDPANPDLRHAPHAVYRRTRVPVTSGDEFATVPRTSYPPSSFAPMPASEELAAELATQRTITAQMRAMQASMADTERQVQAQYALIVRQNAEVLKVRSQLEAERHRLSNQAPGDSPKTAAGTAEGSTDVKW